MYNQSTAAKRILIRCFLLLCINSLFLQFAVISACSSPQVEKTKRSVIMSPEYQRIFADARHSSKIQATCSLAGKIAWTAVCPGAAPATKTITRLLLSRDNIVAQNQEQLFVFSDNGSLLQQHFLAWDSPVALKDGVLYFRPQKFYADEMSGVDLINPENNFKFSVPNSNEECHPIFFEPLADGFLVQAQYIARPNFQDQTVVFRKLFSDEGYTWASTLIGIPSYTPLAIENSHKFILFNEGDVLVYDSNSEYAGDLINKFKFPLSSILGASASIAGTLFLLGQQNSGMSLMALTEKGATLWEINDTFAQDHPNPSHQPPGVAADNVVYVSTFSKVYRINDGEVEWTFQNPDFKPTFFTILSNQDLLVTAGPNLYLLNQTGETISTFQAQDTIMTPPIVDNEGRVIIALENNILICLE